MKEIGGYLELENIYNNEYYSNLFDFNCSRNSLRFLIRNKNIKRIYLPLMNCDVVNVACKKENVEMLFLRPHFPANRKFLCTTASLISAINDSQCVRVLLGRALTETSF